jgi:hypothetical protein
MDDILKRRNIFNNVIGPHLNFALSLRNRGSRDRILAFFYEMKTEKLTKLVIAFTKLKKRLQRSNAACFVGDSPMKALEMTTTDVKIFMVVHEVSGFGFSSAYFISEQSILDDAYHLPLEQDEHLKQAIVLD